MEEQSQIEDTPAISYQHAEGEVYAAHNLEAARDMCPVLGKMSLEEASLLLELESTGKEQIADQPNSSPEKIIITKVQKTDRPESDVAKDTPIAPEQTDLSTHQLLIDAQTRDMLIRQSEAAPTVNDEIVSEEANTTPVEEVKINEELPPIAVKETCAQPDKEVPEPLKPDTGKPPAEPPIRSVKEIVQVPRAKNPPRQIDKQKAPELEPAKTEPAIENTESPAAAEPNEPAPITENLKQAVVEDAENVKEEGSVIETFTAREFIEDYAEPDELFQAEESPTITVPELPAPVARIETALTLLAETLETEEKESEESDKPLRINEILEEIISLPAKFEAIDEAEPEELEEKLEELFIELFEAGGISYTPDLVESFVKLTKAHYFQKLLEAAKDTAKDEQKLPDEIGTREFLQRLRRGLRVMRQALANFYEIGKSVVRLYNLAPTQTPAIA